MSDPKNKVEPVKSEQPKEGKVPQRVVKKGDKITFVTNAGKEVKAKVDSLNPDDTNVLTLVVDKNEETPAAGFKFVDVPYSEKPKAEFWSW